MTIHSSDKKRPFWSRSPRTLLSYLRRKTTRQARKIIQIDEWSNWLGEEMRPFNSLGQQTGNSSVEIHVPSRLDS
ncbi:MAG: hypothetical protein RLZ62_2234 [Bacteroidota bacterium]|jgi:hypothetical protein